jgi:hypothetical protein
VTLNVTKKATWGPIAKAVLNQRRGAGTRAVMAVRDVVVPPKTVAETRSIGGVASTTARPPAPQNPAIADGAALEKQLDKMKWTHSSAVCLGFPSTPGR